ncbi:RNA-directed DNA polymerase, eukaryota, reverse transcriptase zinc-binding domain protein [Tanacetum coccineum]
MLDSATSDMCINPWGRNTHARVLIEISSERAFVDSMVVAIPLEDGSGHSMETLSIEYEWQPPRCDTCKNFDHKDDSCPFKVKAAIFDPKADDEFIQVKHKKRNGRKEKKAAIPRQFEGYHYGYWTVQISFLIALDEQGDASYGLYGELMWEIKKIVLMGDEKCPMGPWPPRCDFKRGHSPKGYDTVDGLSLNSVLMGIGVHDAVDCWILKCVSSSFLLFLYLKEICMGTYSKKKGSSSGMVINCGADYLCFCDRSFYLCYEDVQSVVVIKESLSILMSFLFKEGRLVRVNSGVRWCLLGSRREYCSRLKVKRQSGVGASFVCLPKDEGGLRVAVGDCGSMTYNLTAERNFWDVPIRGNMSWSWRKILQLRPSIREFIWRKIGADVTLPKAAVDEVREHFANTLYGYFMGKRLAFRCVETLVKDTVKPVPVWVKLHDVPVVAYSETGLSIIATNLGKPLMLDSATKDGSGHSMETLSIEYEWQPPRCDTCKIFDHKDDSCPFKVKAAISDPKADDEFIQENNSENNGAKKKHINDDLDFMELKNSFDKLRQEDSIFEVVEDPKMVMGTGSSLDANNEHMSLNSDPVKAQGLVSGKDNKEADVASSSKPKFSFGPLELGDISDSDEDEVFASQEDFNAYMSSTGGGHQREEEEFDLYDDDYAYQVRDLPGQIPEFRDFQLHHGGRK